jgi:cell division control protein 24
VCSTLKTRLERVPGLQRYFEASARDDSFERRGSAACLPAIGAIPPGKQADPVTQMWRFFRLGSSLCALFNALGPNSRLDADIVDDPKACKRGVYHFVQACKAELGYSDEELFTISNVFSDNTSDLLKVRLTTVLKII